jgi:transcriptional regulator with XRE-family HTH domain
MFVYFSIVHASMDSTLSDRKDKAAEIDRRVGAQLRSLRRMAGFSPCEFARMIGCSEREVERFEDGRARLSAARLFEAARALGITVDELFAETEARGAIDAAAAAPGRPARPSDFRVRAVNETHLQALLSLASALVTIH